MWCVEGWHPLELTWTCPCQKTLTWPYMPREWNMLSELDLPWWVQMRCKWETEIMGNSKAVNSDVGLQLVTYLADALCKSYSWYNLKWICCGLTGRHFKALSILLPRLGMFQSEVLVDTAFRSVGFITLGNWTLEGSRHLTCSSSLSRFASWPTTVLAARWLLFRGLILYRGFRVTANSR